MDELSNRKEFILMDYAIEVLQEALDRNLDAADRLQLRIDKGQLVDFNTAMLSENLRKRKEIEKAIQLTRAGLDS